MTTRYTSTAKALHWLMAILFFGLLALGFYMHDLPLSPRQAETLFLAQVGRRHRSSCSSGCGCSGASRIARRRCRTACRSGLQVAAHAGHFLLYALMFAIPLSGWLMSSAKGFQTVWFGVLPIPDLLARTRNSATCCRPST
jgi:cytochrome b561